MSSGNNFNLNITSTSISKLQTLTKMYHDDSIYTEAGKVFRGTAIAYIGSMAKAGLRTEEILLFLQKNIEEAIIKASDEFRPVTRAFDDYQRTDDYLCEASESCEV